MHVTSRYNEAFDETGSLREPYRAFHARTRVDPLLPSHQSIHGLTRSPLGDQRTIFPIPLILDDHEYVEIISRGVRQRALALQKLFYDAVRGEARVYRGTRLPADLFSRILRQEGSRSGDLIRWWHGKSREAVRFTYAPDLVREPEGRWCVLEDNVGCVGGVVDGHLVARSYLAHTRTQLDSRIPSGSDLARAVEDFLGRVRKSPQSHDVVALLGNECGTADSEAGRKRQALNALELRVLNLAELREAKRMGLAAHHIAAVVNFDSRGWTPTSELTDEMFGERSVPLMTSPAIEVLGNKALLPFMDEIVAFYSREDPILRTAKTELCQVLPNDPSGWVLKRTNGCQGREVFFLDDMSVVERDELQASVAKWGDSECAIVQRRVSASFLPAARDAAAHRFQVELRPFGFVVGDSSCVVGQHACGRAFDLATGRHVGNISQGACYVSVIREPVPATARQLLPRQHALAASRAAV
jgi:uncharacterized circularly permuted ATP-grasp superfamily protein